MKEVLKDRRSERGGAGVKFVVFMVGMFCLAHAGYNYVPVAYQGASMKSDMNTAVLQGLAMPGKMNPVDNVRARVQRAAIENKIPADAVVLVAQQGNVIQAHVAYEIPVNILPFGIYKYKYKFDDTATPTGFLLKQ